MRIDWNNYIGKTLNITMQENYGVVYGNQMNNEHNAFYEIVFKTGKLVNAFEEGLLLESQRDELTFQTFVPFSSVKCIDIY
ncbi:MAG: hypothetical protein N2321_06430 [Melioribacteraceae bacterium]|nr:hypothetical protein [Melioribacteraceae bacterium]